MRKKEAIPDLQAHYKDVLTRFEEASKAREQRHKADELKKELAWAHVAAKQEVFCPLIIHIVRIEDFAGSDRKGHRTPQAGAAHTEDSTQFRWGRCAWFTQDGLIQLELET